MNIKVGNVRKVLLVAASALLASFFIWQFLAARPMTEVCSASTFGEYARIYGPTSCFPASASNIWCAHSSVGMGGRARVLKFEAPIDDCVVFAKEEFSRYVKQLYDNPTNYPSDAMVQTNALPDNPCQILKDHYGLRDLDWFDIWRITNGLTIERPRSHLPMVWVDVDRSTLYCYWTD